MYVQKNLSCPPLASHGSAVGGVCYRNPISRVCSKETENRTSPRVCLDGSGTEEKE